MAFNGTEVSLIRGMIQRGDKQHDIAAWFGTNQARIVEAEDGKFGDNAAAAAADLPPRGAPGPKGRRVVDAVGNAITALEGDDPETAKSILEAAIAEFYRNQV